MKLLMVGIKKETKELLDKIKIHHRETYNEVIERLIKYFGEK